MKSPPQKILMTTDTVGGVWTYAVELCRALPQVKFLLANMGPRLSYGQWRDLDSLGNVRVVEGDYPLEWEDDPWRGVEAAGLWLLGLQARYRPDLVHLNGYVHASLDWKVPVVVVAHSCVLSWWRAVKGEDAPPRWSRYARAVEAGLRAAQRVIAPSKAMAGALAKHYRLFDTHVISNGRDGREFAISRAREPLVLCAARLCDEAKNADCLMKIAADLPWPVAMAGDHGGRNDGGSNIKLIGRCDRATMAEWFRRATIYVHPAYYEPFGLAPLEAALAGCALVLADIPSLREIWGAAAEFVAPGDLAGWRAALVRLIEDPVARRANAQRARVRAARFTPRRMAHAYLKCYQELCQRQLAVMP